MKSKTIQHTWFVIILGLLMFANCAVPVGKTENAIPADNLSPQEFDEAFPLSVHGDYSVGIRRNITYTDPARGGREVNLTIWYPATIPEGETTLEHKDAPPDLSRAPYPVILSSSKVGFNFANALVSHGFVYVGVNRIDTYEILDNNLVDQPLDILFALEKVANDPPVWMTGLANTDNAGTLGYSFDGYNSLAVSGARVDPQAYLEHCAGIHSVQPALEAWYIEYLCTLSEDWDAFTAHAGEEITKTEDGLWKPMTDERIKVVMPMSPDGAWLFNQRGLAAVDRPVFFLCAEDEFYAPGEMEYLFKSLGTDEKTGVTFLNRGHMMIYDSVTVSQISHFANAFFGYHLQGREDYEPLFSEDFVNQQNDLAWGVESP